MKKLLTLLLASCVLAMTPLANATPTLKDVEQAVKRDHDYRLAERLMKDVVSAHPDSANDHYVYAELLEHNGKIDQAATELNSAKQIDPSLSFVRNRADYNRLESRVGGSAPAPRVSSNSNNSSNNYVAPTVNAPSVAPAPPAKKSNAWIWAILILAAVGVGAYFLFKRTSKADQAEDEARMKAVRQDQLQKATALLESIKPLKLDVRMANPANPALLSEVEDVERSAIDLIDRLSRMPVQNSELTNLENSIAHLRRKFEGKPDPIPQATYGTGDGRDHSGFGQPINQQYAGQNVPPQQTVIVQQGGNDGGGVGSMLMGMAIGSMMSGGHHDREIIHEVREVHDRDYDSDRRGRDDIDFGNDDSGSSDSGGGDIDFGSGDDN